MDKRELGNRLSRLESMNDQLATELVKLDELMRSIGFSGGLESVKAVAREIISQGVEKQENC